MDRAGGGKASALGVGARLRRKEDARHLLGRGQFVADLRFPGMMDVAFVRSQVAHARIRSIDIPPESRGHVFVAADIPEVLPIASFCEIPGWKHSSYPPLADGKVRFVGQPIAACIAATRAEAEDLAQSVSVEFDELPAVSDMRQALEPDAPILHEEWGDNIYIEKVIEGGDLESARNSATVVVKREYRMAARRTSSL